MEVWGVSWVAGSPVGRGLASENTAVLPGKELVNTDDTHTTGEFYNHVFVTVESGAQSDLS